jgi:plastocyanin
MNWSSLRVFLLSFAALLALATPAIPLAAEDAEPTQQGATPQTAAPPQPSDGLGGAVRRLLRPGSEPAPQPATTVAQEAPPPAPVTTTTPAPEPAVATATKAATPKTKPVAKASGNSSVTIKDFEFAPAEIDVEVGETVTWTNQGPTPHTATAKDGSFDTGILEKGKSGSHKFTRAGTYAYICTPHPNMKGTVVVSAAGGSSDSSGSSDSGSSDAADASDSGTDAGDGEELPNTGFEAVLVAFLGASFITGGYVLRVRLRDRHKPETNA